MKKRLLCMKKKKKNKREKKRIQNCIDHICKSIRLKKGEQQSIRIEKATPRKFSIQHEQIEVMGNSIPFCGSFIVVQHRHLFSLFNAIRRHSQWNHIRNCVKCIKTPNHKCNPTTTATTFEPISKL